jgi:hypothetical protein
MKWLAEGILRDMLPKPFDEGIEVEAKRVGDGKVVISPANDLTAEVFSAMNGELE